MFFFLIQREERECVYARDQIPKQTKCVTAEIKIIQANKNDKKEKN